MKTIGLIGGLSWVATARYYELINREVSRLLGRDHSAPIVIHSVDCNRFVRLLTEGRFDELGEALCAAATALETHGCSVIGLAANSMHVAVDDLAARLSVPFLHILDPAIARLNADKVTTIGLLGTGFTLKHGFYVKRLKTSGFNVLVPEHGVDEMSQIISQQLVHGIVREPSRVVFQHAMETLAQQGAQAILLACTEICLLVEGRQAPLSVYDTTTMHVEELLRAAIS